MSAPVDWRAVLTPEEALAVEQADAAREAWSRLAAVRAQIVNRAIQRAKSKKPVTA